MLAFQPQADETETAADGEGGRTVEEEEEEEEPVAPIEVYYRKISSVRVYAAVLVGCVW